MEGYLRRSLSAANAITPLSTPRAVTALPASISGTAVAYALLANTSSAQPITMGHSAPEGGRVATRPSQGLAAYRLSQRSASRA